MGVAICGMADGRDFPEDVELWGMSWDTSWIKMDVLFDMHHPLTQHESRDERNKDVWVPLYMHEKHHENATEYPVDDVIAIGDDYFTSSIAYMLGLAILKGYKNIDIYGVTGDENYADQRPCIEYWVGIAKGRGIEVNIHGDSELLKASRYGTIGTQPLLRTVI